MRTLFLMVAAAVPLSGCMQAAPSANQAGDQAIDGPSLSLGGHKIASDFPKAGTYDIVMERQGGREESSKWIDVSNPVDFEKMVASEDGGKCRDLHDTIGGGSFDVTMVCDSPDGDLKNVNIHRFGDYSRDSFRMTNETTLLGHLISDTNTYRLRTD